MSYNVNDVKAYLAQELTTEEFRRELDQFWAWVSKRPRSRLSWLMSMADWARGDR